MKILAMGKCAPRQILDNEALSHMVETNDEWIISRTGIRQRRIAKDETVVSMAAEAARQAMERAGTRPEEIGLVLVCTFTPDLATPSVACLVQRELGLPQEILAYDLNAACSGFIYGLVTAEALLSGALQAGGAVRLVLREGALALEPQSPATNERSLEP